MCIRPHLMITGELKSKVDSVWNALWSGGVVNPLTAIEQVTYLLFLRRLDELHTLEENKANRAGKPMARRIFGEGNDSGGTPYAVSYTHLRAHETVLDLVCRLLL